nr:hypothetical protein [uncultured Brevundimonas sp.]
MASLLRGKGVVQGGMGLSSIRQGFLAALLASFLAVFALVPVVDAMACAPEGPAETSILVLEGHSHTNDDNGQEQGVCSHGHCHHSGAAVPSAPAVVSSVRVDRAPAVVRPINRLTSRPPAGPEHPPKA